MKQLLKDYLLFLSHSAFHSSFQEVPGIAGVLVYTGQYYQQRFS